MQYKLSTSGSFRKLQKLSLIKCKRLRADEVRAVGTLAALTSLELPCSKASWPPRDVRPLGRLKVRALHPSAALAFRYCSCTSVGKGSLISK